MRRMQIEIHQRSMGMERCFGISTTSLYFFTIFPCMAKISKMSDGAPSKLSCRLQFASRLPHGGNAQYIYASRYCDSPMRFPVKKLNDTTTPTFCVSVTNWFSKTGSSTPIDLLIKVCRNVIIHTAKTICFRSLSWWPSQSSAHSILRIGIWIWLKKKLHTAHIGCPSDNNSNQKHAMRIIYILCTDSCGQVCSEVKCSSIHVNSSGRQKKKKKKKTLDTVLIFLIKKKKKQVHYEKKNPQNVHLSCYLFRGINI